MPQKGAVGEFEACVFINLKKKNCKSRNKLFFLEKFNYSRFLLKKQNTH